MVPRRKLIPLILALAYVLRGTFHKVYVQGKGALMATFDAKAGMGASNRGRWSNADYDAALGAALRTMDDTKRHALYARAAEVAVAEMGMIPIYFTINTWATRKDLVYIARGDESSLATGLRPK